MTRQERLTERARFRYNTEPKYRERILHANRVWHKNNKEYWKKYYYAKPEIIKRAQQKWCAKHPNYARDYFADRYHNDPEFREKYLDHKRTEYAVRKNKI